MITSNTSYTCGVIQVGIARNTTSLKASQKKNNNPKTQIVPLNIDNVSVLMKTALINRSAAVYSRTAAGIHI